MKNYFVYLRSRHRLDIIGLAVVEYEEILSNATLIMKTYHKRFNNYDISLSSNDNFFISRTVLVINYKINIITNDDNCSSFTLLFNTLTILLRCH
jgi:hypothetical protein